MKDNKVYINQILDSVEKIESFVVGMDEKQFKSDVKTQSAVIMQLSLIGEISKKIDSQIKARVSLPWKDIAGFRDRAIHNYFEIDLEIVWNTLVTDLPVLKKEIQKEV
ncbi:MAG: DUF86 domain-containing protein [Patescibacteria group bacterium]